MVSLLVLDKYANDYAAALRQASPTLDIQTASSHNDEAVDYARVNVLIAFGLHITDELFTRMPNLRWIQSLATGVDHFLRSKTLWPDVILTSGRGIHGPAMRETAAYLMLSISHDSNRAVQDKARHCWERRPWPLLADKTALVIGTGVAGSAIATLLKAFGMTVTGVSRTPRAIDGFDEVLAQSDLIEAASRADYVINVLPADAENRNLIGRDIFARMQRHAYFINVGRGETVDESALIEALQSGAIAGAGLDVFAAEPLSSDSPLWDMPNVFMTPHVGGLFRDYHAKAMPLILHNLKAFEDGRLQDMDNVIDRKR